MRRSVESPTDMRSSPHALTHSSDSIHSSCFSAMMIDDCAMAFTKCQLFAFVEALLLQRCVEVGLPGIRIGWSCLCLGTSPTRSAFRWRQLRTRNPRLEAENQRDGCQLTFGHGGRCLRRNNVFFWIEQPA